MLVCGALAPLAARAAPTALDVAEAAKRIDQLIDQRLGAEKIPASPAAGDSEFLRRATVDLTGRVPTAAFLNDRDRGKRARLIETLAAGIGAVDWVAR